MLRLFVAFTPLAGAILFPLVVPLVISWFGIAPGVLTAVFLTILWFAIMLSTSEMPH